MLTRATEYRGRLSESAKVLLEFLKLSDELSIMMERVYVYANQRYHEDTGNSKYQGLADKAGVLIVQMDSALSFTTPELLAIPENVLDQFKQEEEGLRLYDFYFSNIFRKNHISLLPRWRKYWADAGEMASSR